MLWLLITCRSKLWVKNGPWVSRQCFRRLTTKFSHFILLKTTPFRWGFERMLRMYEVRIWGETANILSLWANESSEKDWSLNEIQNIISVYLSYPVIPFLRQEKKVKKA
ncbi:hypothetical protein Runsl_5026 [Runella slithyformis DSM 19594]|uniref:Uncharacterized protein n=1 Tax=Runella slithyformis (strain ATCC 29530 / DSM 19594 / LMG 11500 / NCIMB 11436 / LSU 4) TaxID=761193 RepID=A0A7U3ZQ57_RUNSL|nr:hypothetical protein Runsl_5026 [Runella slithyformis DSM 19594]